MEAPSSDKTAAPLNASNEADAPQEEDFFAEIDVQGVRVALAESPSPFGSPLNPAKTTQQRQEGSPPPTKDALDYTDFNNMLIEKPSFAFPSREPGGGYQYGPAAPITAANFTRLPRQIASFHPFEGAQPSRRQQNGQGHPAITSTSHATEPSNGASNTLRRPQVAIMSPPTGSLASNDLEAPFNSEFNKEARHQRVRDHPIHTSTPPFPEMSPVEDMEPSRSGPWLQEVSKSPASSVIKPLDASLRDSRNHVSLTEEPDSGTYAPKQTWDHVHPIADSNMSPAMETAEARRRSARSPNMPPYRHEMLAMDPSCTKRKSPDRRPLSGRVVPLRYDAAKMASRPQKDPEREPRTVFERPLGRSTSRSSNVSKRRSTFVTQSSPASDLAGEPRGDSPAPSVGQTRLTSKFANDIASAFNGYTQRHKKEHDKKVQKMEEALKRLRKERSEALKAAHECKTQVESQKKRIEELETSKKLMEDKIDTLKLEAVTTAERIARAEGKYHICKDHLNSAIDEHQELYSRSRRECDEAIQQIQQLEKAHAEQNALMEDVTKRVDATREDMLEKVRQVVTQSNEEIQELNRKLDSATKQLGEKDVELSREKDNARALAERLANTQDMRANFSGLMSQTEEVLGRLQDQKADMSECYQRSETQAQERFGSIEGSLSQILATLAAQPLGISNLQDQQRASAESISVKLQGILESQSDSGKHADRVLSELGAHVQQVSKQLAQNNELHQLLEEKSKEIGVMSASVEAGECKTRELENDLDEMAKVIEEQAKEIEILKGQLNEGGAERRSHEEIDRRAYAAEREVERLQGELKSRIESMETQIRAKDQDVVSLTEKHKLEVANAQQHAREKEATLSNIIDKAAELARQEMRIDLDRKKLEVQEGLWRIRQQRENFEEQLKKVGEERDEKEGRIQQSAQLIKSLENGLAAARNENEAMAEKMKQQLLTIEQFQRCGNDKISALEAEVTTVRKAAAEAREASLVESARLVALIEALKRLPASLGDTGRLGRREEEGFGNPVGAASPLTSGIENRAAAGLDCLPSNPTDHQERTQAECSDTTLEDTDISRFFDQRTETHPPDDVEGGIDDMLQMIEDAPLDKVGDGDTTKTHDALAQGRRVLVQSPTASQIALDPPTVSEERLTRRSGLQPRPIIKPSTRTSEVGVQDAENHEGLTRRGTLSSTNSQLWGGDGQLINEGHETTPKGTRPGLRPRASATKSTTRIKRPAAATSSQSPPKRARKARLKKENETSAPIEPRIIAIGTQQLCSTETGVEGANLETNVSSNTDLDLLVARSRAHPGTKPETDSQVDPVLFSQNLSATGATPATAASVKGRTRRRTYGSQKTSDVLEKKISTGTDIKSHSQP